MPYRSTKICRYRALAYERQSGFCYYCDQPMWLTDHVAFAYHHGIITRQANALRCTAEHLVARQDGGTDEATNIVAACLFCNRLRHRRRRPKAPAKFRQHVRRRIRCGRWLTLIAMGDDLRSH